MKRMTGVALALAMLALSAVSVRATEVAGPDEATIGGEINVTNNSWTPIQVYAEDSEGDLHFLGRVSRNKFVLFEIPAEISELGDFRIKLYPDESDVRPAHSSGGIKTQPLNPKQGELVVVLVEPDLSSSVVLFEQG